MKNYIERLLSVPASDPDDARRRRLLNIMLLGILVAALVGLLAIVINMGSNQQGTLDSETQILPGGIVVVTIGIFGIYQINRRVSGRAAALLFRLLLIILFPFMDTPKQVIEGQVRPRDERGGEGRQEQEDGRSQELSPFLLPGFPVYWYVEC